MEPEQLQIVLERNLFGTVHSVAAVAPGYIGTSRLIEQFELAGVETDTSQTALKRLGTPEDSANVIELLPTDLSDYVTGSVIDVTGGVLW
ncbi:SDR family oxidoreductase [Peribacillus simplex]